MSNIIEKAGKVSGASECYTLSTVGEEVEFENSKLKVINHSESSGSALRIVCDGRIGFSTSTKENNDEKLLSSAVHAARYGRYYDFEFAASNDSSDVKCFNEDVKIFTVERMVDIGKDIIEAIREYDQDILAFASISKDVYNVTITNSSGIEKKYNKTAFSVFGGGKLTEEGNFLYVYDFKAATAAIDESDIEKIKKKIIDDFKIAKKNVPFKSGRFPVLLSPAAVADLMAPVTACSNAKTIQKGISPWRDKIGERVFDERVSIYDDGTAKEGIASCPFDDEGVPTSRTTIIENGMLKGFYNDLATAYALKIKPTGNGMRGMSINSIPSPAKTNLIMSGGDTTFKQILENINEGILIDQLIGTFTSNHLGGQVSGNISLGYKIEDGRLTGRIKDAMFSVNVFDVLKNNIMCLSKEVFWKGSSHFPYILFDDIFISAKAW